MCKSSIYTFGYVKTPSVMLGVCFLAPCYIAFQARPNSVPAENVSAAFFSPKKGVSTFDAIMQLEKMTEQKLKDAGVRSLDAMKVVKVMYNKPIINIQDVVNIIEKSTNTAYKTISLLEDLKILKEITGAQRGKLYLFEDYVQLFEN